MKIPTFLFIGLLGLSLVACEETKNADREQDHGDHQLNASVQAILKEENIDDENESKSSKPDEATAEESDEAANKLLRSLEEEFKKDEDQRNYIVSNKKIESTGFIPKFSLEDGIKELIKGFSMIKNQNFGNF